MGISPRNVPGGLPIPSGPRGLTVPPRTLPAVPDVPGVSGPPAVRTPPAAIRIPPADEVPDAPPARGWGAVAAGAAALGLGGAAAIRWLQGQNAQGSTADPAQAPAPAQTPAVDAQRRQFLDERRRQFLKEQWQKQQAVRYAQQIAQNPAVYNQMVGMYDAAATGANPNDAHRAGEFAARKLTGDMEAQKAAQIQLNVMNAAKQDNVARQMGVSRGLIMAHEDVAESLRKGDHASAAAKAAMYGYQYGPAFAQAGHLITTQHVSEQEAKARAKPPELDPVQNVAKMTGEIGQMAPGMGRYNAVDTFQRARLGGDKAAPEVVQSAVDAQYQPMVQQMIRKGVHALSPEERLELVQATRHLPYEKWAQYTGLGQSRESARIYRDLFGKNANYAQYLDNFGVGGLWRTVTPWND